MFLVGLLLLVYVLLAMRAAKLANDYFVNLRTYHDSTGRAERRPFASFRLLITAQDDWYLEGLRQSAVGAWKLALIPFGLLFASSLLRLLQAVSRSA